MMLLFSKDSVLVRFCFLFQGWIFSKSGQIMHHSVCLSLIEPPVPNSLVVMRPCQEVMEQVLIVEFSIFSVLF